MRYDLVIAASRIRLQTDSKACRPATRMTPTLVGVFRCAPCTTKMTVTKYMTAVNMRGKTARLCLWPIRPFTGIFGKRANQAFEVVAYGWTANSRGQRTPRPPLREGEKYPVDQWGTLGIQG